MGANSNLFTRVINSYTGNPTDAPQVAYFQDLLNIPGQIQGFNAGGAGFDADVYALAIQQDGKILAGGDFTTYNGSAFGSIVRLNIDGSIDASFNPGGAGFNSRVSSIAIQTDGKILCGGLFTDYNGVTYGSLVRLDSSGAIDPAFNFGGVGGIGPLGTGVKAIAIQVNGKILVGGSFTTYNGIAVSLSLIRLDTAGVLDATFNPLGAGFNGSVDSLALQSDGLILVGGSFTTYNAVAAGYFVRLSITGIVDPLFNPGGADFDSNVQAIAIQSDGMILCGGSFTTYNGVAVPDFLVRLSSVGAVDPLFNPGGAGFDNSIQALEIQSDGTILAGGAFTTYNGASVSNYLIKLSSVGIVDPLFNPGGAGFDAGVLAVKITAEGILAGGSLTTFNGSPVSAYLTRLNSGTGNNLLPLNFYGYNIVNPNGGDIFIKLYDSLGAPAVGTDTPVWVIQVPKNGSVVLVGADVILNFKYGLWMAAVTGYQDSDNTAPATGVLSFVHYLQTYL